MVASKVVGRLLSLLLATILVLSIPWFNAMTSDFEIKGNLTDRHIHIVGSSGRYVVYTNSTTNTRVVRTGYYASIFNTVYMFKLNSKKYAHAQASKHTDILRELRTFYVIKIKYINENLYKLRGLPVDPRLGDVEAVVELEGSLGLF
ncbi:hypothetical protein [Vibrio sp. AND4]|uniref:hypothetical protein n=1 Tax=Vibrio sp. AND4 TaxID=314289 RepID=UPI00015EFA63|nr:hypothetical protein [Vibrio sp. AND4]EDP60132.1 hypothetical protein AND4_01948 [Vibrio sp. AND4]